jgi:hypothetical protein
MTRACLLAALLLAAAACVPEEGPMMEPGSDCLECHGAGGGDENGPRWTVAGTWSGRGHRVNLRDAAGKAFTLTSNQAGNFWTAEPLTFPLRVDVDGEPMNASVTASAASCNQCHHLAGGGAGD